LAELSGFNISPAKVKNVVSNFVLNRVASTVLEELKNARPRPAKEAKEGKNGKTSEPVEARPGTPVNNLSQETRDYVAYAYKEWVSLQRAKYSREKVKCLADGETSTNGVTHFTQEERKLYDAALSVAKDKFMTERPTLYLGNSDVFDMEQFNMQYMPDFYKEFDVSRYEDSKSDEWKLAIDRVSKLKNRFSTNSRVFLSAFVEYIIKQLAMNGTSCCVSEGKKIIQLSHVLDSSKEGFTERFPLYPLLVNLETYKQARAYLDSQATKTPTDSKESADDASSKNVDVFSLKGVDKSVQYQFRYYISESCREARMTLAKTATAEAADLYNHTSVSKVFKNFCSTLVCEFLMRVGHMLSNEITTRGVKTVNDTIIGTVISHYHTVCGVDERNTLEFIRAATNKYYKFAEDRQQQRKDTKNKELVETVATETPETKTA
jgi:hypothetical protein